MFIFFFSLFSRCKEKPSDCESFEDLTNLVYSVQNFEANVKKCFLTKGSIFIDAKDVTITGYKNNQNTIPSKSGIAAIFANLDFTNYDYYFVVSSSTNQNNITVYGSIEIPSNQKVLISTKSKFKIKNLLDKNLKEAWMFILGKLPYSKLKVETDDHSTASFRTFKEESRENSFYKNVGRDEDEEDKGEFTLIEIQAKATKAKEDVEVEIKPYKHDDDDDDDDDRDHGHGEDSDDEKSDDDDDDDSRRLLEFGNEIHGSIRVTQDGVFTANDFQETFTQNEGLTYADTDGAGEVATIAGIIIAIVIAIIALVVIIIWLRKRNAHARSNFDFDSKDEIDEKYTAIKDLESFDDSHTNYYPSTLPNYETQQEPPQKSDHDSDEVTIEPLPNPYDHQYVII